MKIFGKHPSYRERIDSEYCVCGQRHQYNEGSLNFRAKQIISAGSHQLGVILAKVPDYQSEYGASPRQAATVREFMFGIGEIIAGVFTCSDGSTIPIEIKHHSRQRSLVNRAVNQRAKREINMFKHIFRNRALVIQ